MPPSHNRLANPPQRMVGRNPLLDRHLEEQGAVVLLLASHLDWAVALFSRTDGFSANS